MEINRKLLSGYTAIYIHMGYIGDVGEWERRWKTTTMEKNVEH